MTDTIDAAGIVAAGYFLFPQGFQCGRMKRHGEGFETSPAPNRNGSYEDHVMAAKALPSQEALRQLLAYVPETGALLWRPKPLAHWSAHRKVVYINRCAGREAFTNECRKGYRNGRFDGVHYQAHRIIWKLVYNEEHPQIDHINGVKNDNRLLNLRPATNAQNSRNYDRRPGSSSYRGVSFVRRDRTWRASIGHEMRKIALGEFRDEEAAARAYDAAAIRLHGEFARLNFPTLAALKEASHG